MKSFALALFAATASASLAEILSFNFDNYFEAIPVEEINEPRLESYTYGWEVYGPTGTGVDSDPFYMRWDFSDVGFVFTANGDANVQFTTPFEGSDDKTQWKLGFVPEANFGGQQKFAAQITKYFKFTLTLDLWPASFKLFDTQAVWTPPFLDDFCWSSGWSLTATKLYSDIKFGLYECDAGLFDYILNGNTHSCGLYAYKFRNNLFKLSYDGFNAAGDIFPESCFATEEAPEEVVDETEPDAATTETSDTTTTGLSSETWFD